MCCHDQHLWILKVFFPSLQHGESGISYRVWHSLIQIVHVTSKHYVRPDKRLILSYGSQKVHGSLLRQYWSQLVLTDRWHHGYETYVTCIQRQTGMEEINWNNPADLFDTQSYSITLLKMIMAKKRTNKLYKIVLYLTCDATETAVKCFCCGKNLLILWDIVNCY